MREQTFIEERDEALYMAYINALRQPDVKSHQQAIVTAINSPTSRFWICPYRAYREILWCQNGKRPSHISKTRNELVIDLYNKYNEIKDKPSFRGCSTFFISQFAVASPTKCFYISYLTASRIIHKKREERRRNAT